jgi:hypothetical protein
MYLTDRNRKYLRAEVNLEVYTATESVLRICAERVAVYSE